MRSLASLLGALLIGMGCASATLAQQPGVQEIIDALKPKPLTRSLGRNLQVKPGISLNIEFEFNSAKLTGTGVTALENLSKAMNSPDLSAFKFRVEGHTDAKGAAAYNDKLSMARAASVVDYLAKTGGVARDRMVASGKGASELLNKDDPFAAENRRVLIVNMSE